MRRMSLIIGLLLINIIQLSQSITSTYSNKLSTHSPTFVRPSGLPGYSYYYQAIQVIPMASATYILKSNSTIDAYGCLYQRFFDPLSSNKNLINCDDDTGGRGQFLIQYLLQTNQTYILVVTTYGPVTIGNYSVLAVGPSTVYMTSMNPSTYTSTITSQPPTQRITTTFSGRLSSNSPTFNRPGSVPYKYYYQSIQTITNTSGSYTLRSYSTIDTYGCLYLSSFNPSFPQQNKITCDDDSGGSAQFLINYYLQYSSTYILVITTYSSGITGDYSISATGPGSLYMTLLTPDIINVPSLTSTQIASISIGCILFFVILVMIIFACKRRRRILFNRQVNSSRNTQTLPGVDLVRMPYTITKPPEYSTAIEEAPPSYEAYIYSLRT